jgi:hypothetical protein
MSDDPTNDDHTELVRVEQQLEDLRRTVRDLRADLKDAGAVDPEDRSLLISQAEEQQAIIAELEQRRDHLRQQLRSS